MKKKGITNKKGFRKYLNPFFIINLINDYIKNGDVFGIIREYLENLYLG